MSTVAWPAAKVTKPHSSVMSTPGMLAKSTPIAAVKLLGSNPYVTVSVPDVSSRASRM